MIFIDCTSIEAKHCFLGHIGYRMLSFFDLARILHQNTKESQLGVKIEIKKWRTNPSDLGRHADLIKHQNTSKSSNLLPNWSKS